MGSTGSLPASRVAAGWICSILCLALRREPLVLDDQLADPRRDLSEPSLDLSGPGVSRLLHVNPSYVGVGHAPGLFLQPPGHHSILLRTPPLSLPLATASGASRVCVRLPSHTNPGLEATDITGAVENDLDDIGVTGSGSYPTGALRPRALATLRFRVSAFPPSRLPAFPPIRVSAFPPHSLPGLQRCCVAAFPRCGKGSASSERSRLRLPSVRCGAEGRQVRGGRPTGTSP
jgi:hypothetical protein